MGAGQRNNGLLEETTPDGSIEDDRSQYTTVPVSLLLPNNVEPGQNSGPIGALVFSFCNNKTVLYMLEIIVTNSMFLV